MFKVSHRAYCTGFLFGHPKECQYYENSGYIRDYDVVAVVEKCEDSMLYAQQRNKFDKGAKLEILSPEGKPVEYTAEHIFDEYGNEVDTANHAMMKFSMPCNDVFPKNSIIRMQK